jgi:hypothetical protein
MKCLCAEERLRFALGASIWPAMNLSLIMRNWQQLSGVTVCLSHIPLYYYLAPARRAQLSDLGQALLQAIKLQTNLGLHGVL